MEIVILCAKFNFYLLNNKNKFNNNKKERNNLLEWYIRISISIYYYYFELSSLGAA